jgi:FlaA1/EpsC-like NDP-sugar epimerase
MLLTQKLTEAAQPEVQADWGRLKHGAALASVHLAAWLISLLAALFLVKRDALASGSGMVLAIVFIAVKASVALYAGSFHELWRHTSLEDLAALTRNSLITTVLLAVLLTAFPQLGAPNSVVLVDGVITLLLLGALQVTPRLVYEIARPALARRGRRIVLAGRPEFVDLELRRMQVRSTGDWVSGLVLEGPALVGARLRQIPVLSGKELEAELEARAVAAVIIVPPAQPAFAREVERLCAASGTPCHSVSSLQALGEVIENASSELLDRPAVPCDPHSIDRFIAGKRVLVTGAGGSLGSELARQLVRHNPSSLALVERAENALFRVEADLMVRSPNFPIEAHLLDIRDPVAVQHLFETFRPHVVFHAAAHKHVPMMERHPSEAVLNNVGGTRRLVDAAHAFGVHTFVFISTDKAVNPTSVMGATKRLGELYVKAMSQLRTTHFVAVRFGNVLGSSGSVLPIFVEQIKRGGPVTVTHPEMNRYFMSIPEACHLVLEAAVLADNGGKIYVLDMGRPVKIVDLARRLIERAGLRPGADVSIVFSGTRPGEKLSEELTSSKEAAKRTPIPGIWSVESPDIAPTELYEALDLLESHAAEGDHYAVLRLMQKIIPEYRSPLSSRQGLATAEGRQEAAASP